MNDIVAVAYDDDDKECDSVYTWQAGQVLANAGYRVVAIADDGYMTKEEAQELYDWERKIAADCFGPGVRSDY